MDAGTHNLKVIFGQERRHLVPLYQRPYVWTHEDQWAPLWDDLRSMADRTLSNFPPRPHFMGAIVLDQADVPYGSIDTRWVIDGQQRLTTMQIVLEAFADCCESNALEQHQKAARKLTRNDDPLSAEEDHAFKVWPTNADQEHFRRVMRARNPKELLSAYGMPNATLVGHPIADAYLYFFRKIDAWLKEEPEKQKERASALFNALKDSIRMVVIDLKEGDDAQLIFETLNARGTPLLPSDLIKNYLFITAAQQGLNREKLYKQYWQHFDNDSAYWRQNVGRGHSQRARLDVFIQHYLTLRMRDEIPVSHLYAAFKGFSLTSGISAEQQLEQLAKYSSIYRSFDKFHPASAEGRFFRRLAAMDVGTAYPFLLELFSRLEPQSPQIARCLGLLESFLVRRMICQMNTRGYNRVFSDLLHVFDGPSDAISERFQAALCAGKADYNIWPSDEEVSQALKQTPIYRTLVRERVNMLLQALNAAMHDGKTEQLLLENLTIEHLMPQSWQQNWGAASGAMDQSAVDERNRTIHLLGNLTLLTKKLNPSISNGPWEQKRKEILAHSALNLNRTLPAEWSESTIRARTQELTTIACDIWDAPSSIRSAGVRAPSTSQADPHESQESPDYQIDDEYKPSSQRQQILQRFWASLLERAKGKAPLLANRSPTTDCWLSAPSGRGGFWYCLTITQEKARIECYIRVKNGQDTHNKAILQKLMEQRVSIEREYGGDLDWQDLPGRIGCRICTVIPGSWQMDEGQWPELQDQMIDRLIRLERALRGPIHDFDVDSILADEPV